ncbi:hypothetical protein DSH57_11975 [Enterococcus faecium]|nr:hypothetical protein [Enterococcus faecium]
MFTRYERTGYLGIGQRPKMKKEGFAEANFSFFVQIGTNLQILLEDRLLNMSVSCLECPSFFLFEKPLIKKKLLYEFHQLEKK